VTVHTHALTPHRAVQHGGGRTCSPSAPFFFRLCLPGIAATALTRTGRRDWTTAVAFSEATELKFNLNGHKVKVKSHSL
jgi:hypothetical protein